MSHGLAHEAPGTVAFDGLADLLGGNVANSGERLLNECWLNG